MKIQFTVRPIDALFNRELPDVEDDLEEFGLDENRNPLMIEIFTEMAQALNEHFSNKEVLPIENDFLDIAKELDYEIEPNANINVEIVLYSNPGVTSFFGGFSQKNPPLGFHASSSGWELFRGDESYHNNAHQVFVCTNVTPLDKFIKESMEDIGPRFDRDDLFENCRQFLITMTHEVSHAIEFIEHGGGLTPHECAEITDDAGIPFNCVYSGGSTKPEEGREDALSLDDLDEMDEDEWSEMNTEILEDRIEEKGQELFSELIQQSPKLKGLIGQLVDAKDREFLKSRQAAKSRPSMSL